MVHPNFINTCLFKSISGIIQFYLNYIYVTKLKISNREKIRIENKSELEQREELIVSLTTFPARIDTVWITIETIFDQTILPDRIILWLGEEQFPEGIVTLPKKLLSLQQRGLEIKFRKNLISHTKYFYAIKENPEAIVITVDDDLFYPHDLMRILLNLYKQYPHDIISTSAQEINDDFFLPQSKWNTPHFNHINHKIAKCRILGVSGVLYPPNSLHLDVFNIELMKICPWADDLWLTIMAVINGTKIVRYEFRSNPLCIKNTQKFSLWKGNRSVQKLSNDDQWQNLTEYYKTNLEKVLNK
ncbi:glycosyl transferase [Bacteroidia bacterium]|nr:glycosyl transferase [Bacteroidia bacterium]